MQQRAVILEVPPSECPQVPAFPKPGKELCLASLQCVNHVKRKGVLKFNSVPHLWKNSEMGSFDCKNRIDILSSVEYFHT